MDVELRHLRYFVAVAEELSFTRAAERLHIAQPPLSTQIRKLERELGVELFDRSRRAVALTAAGDVLLVEARRLLEQVDQSLRAAVRAGTGEVGRLAIGFVPSASNALLPSQLRAFHGRYPGVELTLREMAPDDLVAAVLAGGIDVCFLYLPFADERLRTRTVLREPLVAALPAEHRLAGGRRKTVALEQLRDEPFVLPARHHMPGLNAGIVAACRSAGFEPEVVQRDVWLLQTVLGLVAAGLGVALVPASVQNLNRAGVVFRPLRDAHAPIEMGAFWRAGDGSAALANFVAMLPTDTSDGAASEPG
ncbi:LysR family transcriptional regulator [Conexibacter sp. CPCC 206217]|uniref:LysR family transcriptional regulator n=1 Tax=Conexibacter sp. CPCC 206217 TaxID=3064574 RepID=UPI0027264871|nr:LysR family transcriptional regulator [Conexibacter sp. CPCC 206217]MDO8212661.1 LysR family transcriptional regulator [Conexibacter sp. CPCC 206217]